MDKMKELERIFHEAWNAQAPTLSDDTKYAVLATAMQALAEHAGLDVTEEEIHACLKEQLKETDKATEDFKLQTKMMN